MQHNLPNNKDLFELWVDTSDGVNLDYAARIGVNQANYMI